MLEDSSENLTNPPLRHRAVIKLAFMLLLGIVIWVPGFLNPTQEFDSNHPNPEPTEIVRAQEKLPVATYIITRADGKTMPFALELARTEEEQEKGLMFRNHMEANEGMIFTYSGMKTRRMWMKNTILSLDMLFVDDHGTIVDIARNTTPYSEDIIESDDPAQDVVELRAGVSDAYGIQKGDTIALQQPHATVE